MGILADKAIEERLARALKFVKVATTKEGYLTDVSVVLIMVQLKHDGISVALSNADQQQAHGTRSSKAEPTSALPDMPLGAMSGRDGLQAQISRQRPCMIISNSE